MAKLILSIEGATLKEIPVDQGTDNHRPQAAK